MRYPAVLTREGRHTLAGFPSCPGCQTFAEPGEGIEGMAQEALEGWLEAHLVSGQAPPRPPRRAPKGRVIWAEVPAKLAVKLDLRWARQAAGLTQAQLAELAGVSQPMIAKLEHPDYNPTIDTLEKVARALGVKLRVSLEAQERAASMGAESLG